MSPKIAILAAQKEHHLEARGHMRPLRRLEAGTPISPVPTGMGSRWEGRHTPAEGVLRDYKKGE